MRHGLVRTIGLGTILVLATACSSTSSADEAKEKSLAEQLVKEAKSAGVASGLTVSSAEALYGTRPPTLRCSWTAGSARRNPFC